MVGWVQNIVRTVGKPTLRIKFWLFHVIHCLCLFLFCREIFPYLVVVIGLENVLVLTKSVVSTPVDLEVKLRIAQGKSERSVYVEREGFLKGGITCLMKCVFFFFTLWSIGLSNESWSIMKNMATELCIILIGYFTLVPAIQVSALAHPSLTEIVFEYPSTETVQYVCFVSCKDYCGVQILAFKARLNLTAMKIRNSLFHIRKDWKSLFESKIRF